MITLERFRLLEAVVTERGYGPTIAWSETVTGPVNADDFAKRTIYVICNSGMTNAIAIQIYGRCLDALQTGNAASAVFGHPGKSKAIDAIWADREAHFEAYLAADNKVAQLRSLPWIGDITALHLAKNMGADTAKPDVHLERLARHENVSTSELCERLARETGYRVATIDTVLWRACALKVLNSRIYEAEGWDAAFRP